MNARPRSPLVLALAAILVIASCATQPNTSEDAPSDTTTGSNEEGTEPFSLADCQSRFGHPCNAFRDAWRTNGTYPQPVTGSFASNAVLRYQM